MPLPTAFVKVLTFFKDKTSVASASTAEDGSVAPSEKSRTREYAEKTKSYLAEKMPKQRREQAIWRLKKMVIEIQGHADYQQAIETLLSMAEKYAGHTKDLSQQSTGAFQDVRSTDSVTAVETSLRTLIERFANSTSLEDFFASLNNIYRDADKDPELKGWFKNINTYIRYENTQGCGTMNAKVAQEMSARARVHYGGRVYPPVE